MRRLAIVLAATAFRFRLHHQQSATVHFDVKHRHGFPQDLGKLQLDGALHLRLLSYGQIGPYGLGVPLNSFAYQF